MKRVLGGVLAMTLFSGCATVRTLDANSPGAPVVYAGTRLDLYVINGGCCPKYRFGAEAPAFPRLDLPGSMLLDTLILPLSLLTAAGITFQASGGL
ncbi:YceK/YidQ family lipoprotein [Pseudomonas putida]|uniref:YceK/YidQ family lipoprotein n=1 Tax=Pseudomonas TaxID=286 RepID=UPI0006D3F119|nr:MULTISPECIES: YceK/YidQ family lipoprotein [Pseudomonas]MBI6941648.1 YceK/YidQ family lipoprotein [Pseudomonas putida]MBI6957907.1 YceK/YidQ family lipoprotein [Pseudomonas putida]PZQ39884.1 MAG: YceK/YidQ family lipoprotein [Pseudomonas putida]